MTSGTMFEVVPLEATFGAVVTDINLVGIDDTSFTELYATWLKYALLIFPEQHLSNEEQVEFARRFGDLEFDLVP